MPITESRAGRIYKSLCALTVTSLLASACEPLPSVTQTELDSSENQPKTQEVFATPDIIATPVLPLETPTAGITATPPELYIDRSCGVNPAAELLNIGYTEDVRTSVILSQAGFDEYSGTPKYLDEAKTQPNPNYNQFLENNMVTQLSFEVSQAARAPEGINRVIVTNPEGRLNDIVDGAQDFLEGNNLPRELPFEVVGYERDMNLDGGATRVISVHGGKNGWTTKHWEDAFLSERFGGFDISGTLFKVSLSSGGGRVISRPVPAQRLHGGEPGVAILDTEGGVCLPTDVEIGTNGEIFAAYVADENPDDGFDSSAWLTATNEQLTQQLNFLSVTELSPLQLNPDNIFDLNLLVKELGYPGCGDCRINSIVGILESEKEGVLGQFDYEKQEWESTSGLAETYFMFLTNNKPTNKYSEFRFNERIWSDKERGGVEWKIWGVTDGVPITNPYSLNQGEIVNKLSSRFYYFDINKKLRVINIMMIGNYQGNQVVMNDYHDYWMDAGEFKDTSDEGIVEYYLKNVLIRGNTFGIAFAISNQDREGTVNMLNLYNKIGENGKIHSSVVELFLSSPDNLSKLYKFTESGNPSIITIIPNSFAELQGPSEINLP